MCEIQNAWKNLLSFSEMYPTPLVHEYSRFFSGFWTQQRCWTDLGLNNSRQGFLPFFLL